LAVAYLLIAVVSIVGGVVNELMPVPRRARLTRTRCLAGQHRHDHVAMFYFITGSCRRGLLFGPADPQERASGHLGLNAAYAAALVSIGAYLLRMASSC
jgi:hypothetical protein